MPPSPALGPSPHEASSSTHPGPSFPPSHSHPIENPEKHGSTQPSCVEEGAPAEEDVAVEKCIGYKETRRRVAAVIRTIIPLVPDFAQEIVQMIADASHLFPLVPGLHDAAEMLLQIWRSLQSVKANSQACLSLTNRCATILTCVVEELGRAGGDVVNELGLPFDRLLQSFLEVQQFVDRMKDYPLLKRYLKREEIQQAIAGCNSTITDTLGNFTTANLTCILKQILAAEHQRQADTAALMDSPTRGRRNPPQTPKPPSTAAVSNDQNTILVELQSLIAHQSKCDQAHEVICLQEIFRTTLNASNHHEIILILQVDRRNGSPEVIKTLQRALEKEVQRSRQEEDAAPSVPADDIPQIAQSDREGLKRSLTVRNMGGQKSSLAASSARTGRSPKPRDTLNREFIEVAIEALRTLGGAEVTLPNWTITQYEIAWDQEPIGTGTFSKVFKGRWNGRVVAVKVFDLPLMTPRELFVDKMSIWKTLQHPNVCELLGASSGFGDPRWFSVSPYYKCGSLVTYLQGLPSLDSVDLLKAVHEIAKGMTYLHSKGVLHGNLKAANVLVDDELNCVISDFDLSMMKSGARHHGNLRWQAPELMSGQSNLTQKIDVYAFAITIVELLTKGAPPWPRAVDEAVRRYVLQENMRPELPLQRDWSQQLIHILHKCWDRHPEVRPPFARVQRDVAKLRARYPVDLKPSESALQGCQSDGKTTIAEPPRTEPASTSQSLHGTAPGSPTYHEYSEEYTRSSSPSPSNIHAKDGRDERRYRMLLQHEFHPSLTLPLWTPTPVTVGAVGYHSKAEHGKFVTLFNCFDPRKTSNGRTEDISSIYSYGGITNLQKKSKVYKRSILHRIVDQCKIWLSSRNHAGQTKQYSHCYSSSLRSGHRAALLITESSKFEYLEDPLMPKKWFKANVDRILEIYGAEHSISKEELYLVIGTLEAQDYGLFVSHEHPDVQVNFKVFSRATARTEQSWGEFSFSFEHVSSSLGGPNYEEPVENQQHTCKVSTSVNPQAGKKRQWDSVLLARLRFQPDSVEPTLL